MDNSNFVIAHHGIKGQRWGLRRFQNRDGSLTPLGKQRQALNDLKSDYKIRKKENSRDSYQLKKKYKEDKLKIKKATEAEIERERARKVQAEKEWQEKKQQEKAAQKEQERKDKVEELILSGDADEIMKNKDIFTTQELQAAAARLEVERRVQGFTKEANKKPANDKVNSEKLGKQLVAGIQIADKTLKSTVSAYNSLAMILKTVYGRDVLYRMELPGSRPSNSSSGNGSSGSGSSSSSSSGSGSGSSGSSSSSSSGSGSGSSSSSSSGSGSGSSSSSSSGSGSSSSSSSGSGSSGSTRRRTP